MIEDRIFKTFPDGLFKPYIEKFVEFKRSKGVKFGYSALVRMKALNYDLDSYGQLNVTKEIAEKIMLPRDDDAKYVRAVRIGLLRQFLDFMNLIGIECYRIPKHITKSVSCDFRPYIFSDDELGRLFLAADSLRQWEHVERRNEIYPILLRLLASSGIRIGEALHLKPSDIDINTGVMRVINGKNGVSRYVPLSDSMLEHLTPYWNRFQNDPLLFTSRKTGGAYAYGSIRHTYVNLCHEARIYRADGSVPNMHSLRHTFCTKSLSKLLESGMDLYTAVPVLAAYVGHINFRDTEVYIHFSESGFNTFLEKQSHLERIIPEVTP